MTPETAQTDDKTGSLRELITPAQVVLWDFDGPICRLFAGRKAEQVARDLMTWLRGQGLHGLLTESERDSLDPHIVLRSIDARRPDSDLVTELEKRLTMEELKAASSAMPTAYADPLIRTWKAVGSRLAITTNNSPGRCANTWRAAASSPVSSLTYTAARGICNASSLTRTVSTGR